MGKIYSYNEDTKVLHIYGYCNHSTHPAYPKFNSKDEVHQYTHGNFRECRICTKKSEQLLRDDVNGGKK